MSAVANHQSHPGPGEIIVLHGPSGGTGRTTLALHLAYLYAAKDLQTVLVDLSQYGAILPRLGLPRHAGSGVAGLTNAAEGSLARLRTLATAPGTGERLHLVLSSGPAKMDQVRAADVERLLGHLAASARVVIVDTGSELTDRTLGALMAATRVLLTVCPHLSAGWEALELLEVLRSAYIPKERLGVALTRVQEGGGRFRPEEYAQVLGLPVLGVIPESPSLRAAGDRGGQPNIRDRSAGLLAIRQLAHQLVPIFRPEELRRPWLSRK